ncbi:MAG: nucleotide exchange factor GrpE [Aquificae bacterium]|nr:nucleotide exchange factor GrpE [Aquificota bacterium]
MEDKESKKEEIEEKENVEELKKQIQELEKKLERTEEAAKKLSLLYQSLQEDFEGYKRRTQREKEELKEESVLKVAKGFLDILDNFEKALESAKVTQDVNALMQGIEMIHYQLVRFLKEHGIEAVETAGTFNPMEHEVLETIYSTDHKPNEIVKVIQKGYKFKGKVIRPAKVVVALSPDEKEEIT